MCRIYFGVSRCPRCPLFNLEVVSSTYCFRGSLSNQIRCDHTTVQPLETEWFVGNLPWQDCGVCFATERVRQVTLPYLGSFPREMNEDPMQHVPSRAVTPIQAIAPPPNTPDSGNNGGGHYYVNAEE
ncbi:hypothetical protein S7711_10602 [Stachybotrys chartarum IBT 7711]|uniref:Uncharacterized protein n=1 Tax=Stachybotrys chartarum (strain CBS 109288 / IBT 7711) TaxID=1280523 RepID=A0A084AYX4_STACB|nr:hypothetical protein S7711_10602 [Stachybotrys chartarum IBT 7711]KFA54427.1 hypothetical protein S40293_10810 [Stachybotrys chartarum IBT 40293]KFA79837.1 hypothetical protein S40288_10507 [Stachybotrys chartarum IBT 40288]